MTTAATICITGVRKVFKGKAAVDVTRLELKPGRTLALLGPSGSGKSTLLSIVGLLEKPDAGTIELDGVRVSVADRAARMTMAAAFQRTYLFKGTVGENVAYGLRLRRVSGAETAERVAAALERVGLPGWQDRSALTLSGGEAQRVALARALVLRPRILLLDEPLASLDPIMKWRLTRDFAQILSEERVTTLYVTHDQDEALAVADDVAIMREGRIVAHGPVDEVFGLPADDWTAGFLGMEPAIRGRVLETRDGVAHIDCGGVDLFAIASVTTGSEVSFGVRPEDVLLFEADVVVPVSSARNRLDAVVAEIDPSGATFRVVIEQGSVRIAARISRAALADLRLSVGTPVQALFKATAVRVAST
ncbi:MAG: ABC transporter ATP-binding protein [Actinobacteria bacterium]|nr:MAG: ABC transporter ATP-binding protein [Actinomycetota bacterium]